MGAVQSLRWCDACPSAAQSAALYPVGRIWLCCDHYNEVRLDSQDSSGADSWAIRAKLRTVESVQAAALDAHAALTRGLVAALECEKRQREDQLHRKERRDGNVVFEATGWSPLMDGEYSFVGGRLVGEGKPTHWLAVWQLVRRGKRARVSVDLLGGEPPPEVTATVKRLYATGGAT